MLHVRHGRPDDHQWIQRIEQRCGFEPQFQTSFDDWLFCLRSLEVIVGWVGHGSVVCFAFLDHRKNTHVISFHVDPEWRRDAVGSRLIRYAKHLAASRGSRKIKTKVLEDNLPGQMFLKSAGFKCVKQEPTINGDLYHFSCRIGESDQLVEVGGVVPPNHGHQW